MTRVGPGFVHGDGTARGMSLYFTVWPRPIPRITGSTVACQPPTRNQFPLPDRDCRPVVACGPTQKGKSARSNLYARPALLTNAFPHNESNGHRINYRITTRGRAVHHGTRVPLRTFSVSRATLLYVSGGNFIDSAGSFDRFAVVWEKGEGRVGRLENFAFCRWKKLIQRKIFNPGSILKWFRQIFRQVFRGFVEMKGEGTLEDCSIFHFADGKN